MIAGHLQIKRGIYYIVLSYVDIDGKRKQPWISTRLKAKGNKKKAEEMLYEYRKTYIPPAQTVISLDLMFGDYLKYWLGIKKASIAPTTYSSYQMMINKVIAPYFDARKLTIRNVKPHHIQVFYNTENLRVSAATVARYHNVIHGAYMYLLRLDCLRYNPADRVVLPKKQRYIAQYYNVEELNNLFEVSKNHPLNLLIKVTACYGLRRSEVLGLRWDAIDFETNRLVIKHTVTQTKIDGCRELCMSNRTKTQSSLRTLPLLGDIKDLLLSQRELQKRNMRICGKSYNHDFDDYIFVDGLGNLFKPDYVTSGFRELLEKNNLKKIRFHDLRHSCATLLLANEVPMKLIQEWLGHSDISTTANIYSHTDYSMKLISAGIMGDSLKLSDSE